MFKKAYRKNWTLGVWSERLESLQNVNKQSCEIKKRAKIVFLQQAQFF